MTLFKDAWRQHAVPVLVMATIALPVATVGAESSNDDPHAHHKQMMRQQAAASDNLTDIVLSDAVLITQYGAEVSLRSGVVGDRIVVIDFVYTTCTTVCPVLSAIFTQVQKKLNDRLGGEVVMVSLSVDPSRDTPARLRSYSTKLGAGDGWLWLTGRKQTVDEVLGDLGAYTPNFEDHPSMVLVGDGQTGKWARFLGFPSAQQIVKKVDEFSAARETKRAHVATREK